MALSTTLFTVILKIVFAVRCKASLALLRWCTPKQATIPVCLPWLRTLIPNCQAKQSPVWQLAAPPQKRLHGAHWHPSQRKNCLGSVGLDGWSNRFRHHVIIYNFQAITNSTNRSVVHCYCGLGDGGGSAELREGLTLLAHKLQAFRSCPLKGSKIHTTLTRKLKMLI